MTRTVYDKYGRVTETIYPDGSTSTTTYDQLSNVIAQTDQLGQTTQYQYDVYGRLTAVILPAVVNPATGLLTNPEYTYGYDAYGDQTSIADPNGGVTSFTYDQFGNETSRTLPLGQTETFDYDSFGRQDEHTDFQGDVIDSVFSDAGFLSELDEYSLGQTLGVDQPAQTTTYQYDALGDVTQSVAADGTTNTTYNQEEETTQISTPEGVLNDQYDGDGRVIRMFTSTLADPSTPVNDFQYTYDAFGELTNVSVVERNGVDLTTPETTTYQYNADGELTEQTAPNGVITTYSYDTMGHVTQMVDYAPDATPNDLSDNPKIDEYDYTYRADGLKASETDSLWQDDTPEVSTYSWSYDALDRLTQEIYSSYDPSLNYTDSYMYDLDGNVSFR